MWDEKTCGIRAIERELTGFTGSASETTTMSDSADSSKDFCAEFYTEDTIAAFEKLNGQGYIGSQGKAMTEVRSNHRTTRRSRRFAEPSS